MNGRPAIRFSGKDHFGVEPYLSKRGPVTAFVVSQRLPDQAGGGKWQRLLSTCAPGKPDNKEPYFCLTGDRRGEAGAYEPVIYVMLKDGIEPAPLGIGARPDGSSGFRGDIAEVLVYERGFVSEDALFDVFRYLERKWGAAIGRENMGWTLTGPLENPPKRANEKWPLSDQANAGGWVPLPEMGDEFDRGALDEAKWQSPAKWKGRPPGLFMRDNVAVGDGMLTLAMRKEDVPEMAKFKGTYHTYTSAYVSTRRLVRYGYFEIRAKPMDSAGSSAFWFAAGAKDWRTEIDVFEIGGKAPGKEHSYNMNLHVFREGGKDDHWNTGGTWMAPFRLADDFHVYGLEWSPEVIRYFVDGVVVRSVPNGHWHYPMHLIFDSETMPDWFGLPEDKDLPSFFRIDYVRAWKKADWGEVVTEEEAETGKWGRRLPAGH